MASVPLARCSLLAKSCGVCIALQDPYCAWSVRDGQCVSLVNSDPERLDSANFLQVSTIVFPQCAKIDIFIWGKRGIKQSKLDLSRFQEKKHFGSVFLLFSKIYFCNLNFMKIDSEIVFVLPYAFFQLFFKKQPQMHFSTQNVFTGQHEGCGHDSSLDSADLSHTGIKMFVGNSESGATYRPQAKTANEQNAPKEENLPVEKIEPVEPGFDIPGLTKLEPHHHYSAEELSMAVATSCVCALVVGFITGFLMSRRCSCSARDDDNPYHVPYLNQLVFVL